MKYLLLIIKIIFIKSCHLSCIGCYVDSSNKNNTNCHSCNTAAGYYRVDGYLSLCKNDEDKPQGYYFSDPDQIFKQCYITCSDCSSGGNYSNHNCDVCKEDYYKNKNNCELECPEDLFSFRFNCVTYCNEEGFYLDLFSKTCTEDCISGTIKNDQLGLCTIQTTSEYEEYECKTIINEIIRINMKFFISDNSLIVGKNCYIQVYNSLDQYKIHKVAEK
jgi:hypothetical protein